MASKKNYWVDWEDQYFPKIRHAKFASPWQEDFLTLGEAKKEIIEHFQSDITHARQQIRAARELRAEDVNYGD